MESVTTHEMELVLETEAKTDITVTVTDCVAEPDAEAVSTVMDTIISEHVLTDADGNLAAMAKAAYHVTTTKKTVIN